jgi:hypothetical protein
MYYPLTTIPINLAIEIGFSININCMACIAPTSRMTYITWPKIVSHNNRRPCQNFVDISTTHKEENPHKMEQ